MPVSFCIPIAMAAAERLCRVWLTNISQILNRKERSSKSSGNIRERVEALKEKVSGLSDTLGKVEKHSRRNPELAPAVTLTHPATGSRLVSGFRGGGSRRREMIRTASIGAGGGVRPRAPAPTPELAAGEN